MNNSYIKTGFYFATLLLLLLPLLQGQLKIFPEEKLMGSYTSTEKKNWGVDPWLAGDYQSSQEKYFEENIGFRSFFVKLNNQIYYSFYNHARANGILIGKENYLYESAYIDAYLGREFSGNEHIEDKLDKLRFIRDTLAAKGKQLLFVLAPGKGSFYPEFIPDYFEPERKSITNYELYDAGFKAMDLHYIDLLSWFLEHKETSPYPLYPKTGIHWSEYAQVFVMDTILAYMKQDMALNVPDIHMEPGAYADELKGRDQDVEDGMNLLFDIEDLEMGYRSFTMSAPDEGEKAYVLTIGDSFYSGLYTSGFSLGALNDGEFWYYNQHAYASDKNEALSDRSHIVESYDAVMIMMTEGNLARFAYDFVDQLSMAYGYQKKQTKR